MTDIMDTPSLYDVMRMPCEYMRLSKKWRAFLGNLPARSGWSIGITGAPGTGKSTFCLHFAGEMSRHGGVLYAMAEEALAAGTIQQRVRQSGLSPRARIVMPEIGDYATLRRHLDTGLYRTAIIDSVNEVRGASDDVITLLSHAYPDMGFLFVYTTTKNRARARGSGANEHRVSCMLRSERRGKARYVVAEKNRYGGSIHEYFVFSE